MSDPLPSYVMSNNHRVVHGRRMFVDRPPCTVNLMAASPSVGSSSASGKTSGMNSVKGIVAGGISGALEICITFPTEYIKTQLQLDEKTGVSKKYKGIADCVRQNVRSHGVLGVYRGLNVLLYFSIPKSAVRFGAFEEFKRHNVSADGTLTAQKKFLCGLGAGISEALLVVTPQETIKVKFINDQNLPKPQYRGFFHGVREIVRQQGIRGTYQGLTATMMKQGTNQAIRFSVMESLKELYRGKDNVNKPVPKWVVGLFGIIAGAASVFGNTPLDVIKTRMQSLEASKYRNTLDCAIKIMKHEGPKAFYKGTIPRLSRVCLDVSISFMIYDSFMDLFNRAWPAS